MWEVFPSVSSAVGSLNPSREVWLSVVEKEEERVKEVLKYITVSVESVPLAIDSLWTLKQSY